jgi:hypothetical protein
VNNIVGNSPIVVAILGKPHSIRDEIELDSQDLTGLAAVNYAAPANTQTDARGAAGVLTTKFTFTGNNGQGGTDEYKYFTDGNWRLGGAWFIPDGLPDFTAPDYNDLGSPWAGASVEGGYGIGPWGILPEPTARNLC